MSVLSKIADLTRVRVDHLLKKKSLSELQQMALASRTPWDFVDQFASQKFPVIAEVKLASPSEGRLYSGDLNPVQLAESYLQNQCAAISVLTEPDFFSGSDLFLQSIREHFPQARLLMKDFVVDEAQIYQARICGADCVLLIVALLEEEKLKRFYDLATSIGLSVLVEVHDEAELAIAYKLQPKILGINNRNLKTLQISLETSRRLIALWKSWSAKKAYLISESGLNYAEDLCQLKLDSAVDGFLIGSSFMKAAQKGLFASPGLALKNLLDASEKLSQKPRDS